MFKVGDKVTLKEMDFDKALRRRWYQEYKDLTGIIYSLCNDEVKVEWSNGEIDEDWWSEDHLQKIPDPMIKNRWAALVV